MTWILPIDSSPEQIIRALARKHNIVATRTNIDEFADKIAELEGILVMHDEIEDLVITMCRQGIISSEQAINLYSDYLDNSNTLI